MRSAVPLLLLIGCVPWSDTDLDGDGISARDGDCDDTDSAIYPGARDFRGDGIDDNCDGVDGTDRDGDGRASLQTGGLDCDDENSVVHPAADEICDGLDNDCDGDIDVDAVDARPWYVDVDGDTYGSSLEDPVYACTEPNPSLVADGTDCDDGAATIHPGAVEQCGRDFDCDGVTTACAHPAATLVDQEADWTVQGVEPGSWAGQAVAAVGDINGDGWPDLALGAPKEASGGGVYVFQGPLGGGTPRSLEVTDADAVLSGEGAGAQAGVSLVGVGDLDADGFDDLLVGANLEGGAGAAYVIHGPLPDQLPLSQADAELIGESDGDEVGWAVAAAGDVDADGLPDLLVSAPFHGPNRRGAVYLVSAADVQTMSLADATVKFQGDVDGGWVGWDIAGNADFDGDGLADMLFGAPTAGAGRAYLQHGTGSGTAQTVKSLSTADVILTGASAGDEAGAAVAFGGDLDGDGMTDALVAAPGGRLLGEEVGLVYVVLSDPSVTGGVALDEASAILAGQVDGDRAGNTLSSAGDVDGDGVDDFLVGCVMCDQSGRVYLVHGPVAGQLELEAAAATRIVGGTDGDLLGAGLASADWNGDGYADILVGSPQGDAQPQGMGRALLVVGGVL